MARASRAPVAAPVAAAVAAGVAGSLMLGAAAMSLKAQMTSVVEPTTNVLFAVGAEADPSNGPDAAKVTAERWAAAEAAARTLNAGARDLLSPASLRPGETWSASAKALGDLALAAQTAAASKDGAKLSEAVNAIADTCTACHAKYKTP